MITAGRYGAASGRKIHQRKTFGRAKQFDCPFLASDSWHTSISSNRQLIKDSSVKQTKSANQSGRIFID